MSPSERVNLRIDVDTHAAYVKVAKFFRISVPELIRQQLLEALPQMEAVGGMIDAAEAGDEESKHRLFMAIMNRNQAERELVEGLAAREGYPFSDGKKT